MSSKNKIIRSTKKTKKAKSTILHILGASGAGKTTLGKRLSQLPNTLVIDTDDIDDPNSMTIIPKYAFTSKKDDTKYESELTKLNKKQLDNILQTNKGKIIIFVGFFHAGMRQMETKVTKGYTIKITPEKLWRQYNLRTATYIHENYNEIKSMLNNDAMVPDKIHMILSKKFGIRDGFDCGGLDDFNKYVDKQEARAKTNKYFYGTSDEIFQDISEYLAKQNGGGKIALNSSNSEIECIDTNEKLNKIKDEIIRITSICEPEDDEYQPIIKEPFDQFWIIKHTGTKDIAGYIKTTDLQQFESMDAFELLGASIVNSAPISLSMMYGGAVMAPERLAAITTLALTEGQRKELEEMDPTMKESEKMMKALGMAGAESVFESLGSGTIGRAYRDIAAKEGKEAAKDILKNGLVTAYKKALEKTGPIAGFAGEGLEEAATQITQNVISGRPTFEGVADAFAAGAGGGVIYTAPISAVKAKKYIQNKVETYQTKDKIGEILKDKADNIDKVYNVPVASEITPEQI